MSEDPTVDLSTLQATARCSDGKRRRLILTPAIIAIVTRMLDVPAPMAETAINPVADKPVKVLAGIPLNVAALAVDAFLREVASGDSGPHLGVRNGLVLHMEQGCGEPEAYLYVYQTATLIVVGR